MHSKADQGCPSRPSTLLSGLLQLEFAQPPGHRVDVTPPPQQLASWKLHGVAGGGGWRQLAQVRKSRKVKAGHKLQH